MNILLVVRVTESTRGVARLLKIDADFGEGLIPSSQYKVIRET
jgi:hypothetical protein